MNLQESISYLSAIEKIATIEILITLPNGTTIGVSESPMLGFSQSVDHISYLVEGSFKGISIKAKDSESGVFVPNSTSFDMIKVDAVSQYAYKNADIDITFKVQKDPYVHGNTTPYQSTYKFKCLWASEYDGMVSFECEDFLSAILKNKKFPDTPLVKDLFATKAVNTPLKNKDSSSSEDEYCVPVIYGEAYIPLRPCLLEMAGAAGDRFTRFYLLGPAGDYRIDRIKTPIEWDGRSTWDNPDLNVISATSGGVEYRLFEAIVAKKIAEDGTVSMHPAVWTGSNTIYDLPTLFSSSASRALNQPIPVIIDILKRCGVPESLIDAGSASAAQSVINSRGPLTVNWGFRSKEDAAQLIAELCRSMGVYFIVTDKVYFRIEQDMTIPSPLSISNEDFIASGNSSANFNRKDMVPEEYNYGRAQIAVYGEPQSEPRDIAIDMSGGGVKKEYSQVISIRGHYRSGFAQKVAYREFEKIFKIQEEISVTLGSKYMGILPKTLVEIKTGKHEFGQSFSDTIRVFVESVEINRDLSVTISGPRYSTLTPWMALPGGPVSFINIEESGTWETVKGSPVEDVDEFGNPIHGIDVGPFIVFEDGFIKGFHAEWIDVGKIQSSQLDDDILSQIGDMRDWIFEDGIFFPESPTSDKIISESLADAILNIQETQSQIYQKLQEYGKETNLILGTEQAYTKKRVQILQNEDSRIIRQTEEWFVSLDENINSSIQEVRNVIVNGTLSGPDQSYSALANWSSTLTTTAGDAFAGVGEIRTAFSTSGAGGDSAVATWLQQTQANIGDKGALVQTHQSAIAGINGTLSAQYTIKTEVINGDERVVSSMGLISSDAGSEIRFHADKFIMSFPGAGNKKPFVMTRVNNIPILYLDTDMILNGSIVVGKMDSNTQNKINSAVDANGVIQTMTTKVGAGWIVTGRIRDAQSNLDINFTNKSITVGSGGTLTINGSVQFKESVIPYRSLDHDTKGKITNAENSASQAMQTASSAQQTINNHQNFVTHLTEETARNAAWNGHVTKIYGGLVTTSVIQNSAGTLQIDFNNARINVNSSNGLSINSAAGLRVNSSNGITIGHSGSLYFDGGSNYARAYFLNESSPSFQSGTFKIKGASSSLSNFTIDNWSKAEVKAHAIRLASTGDTHIYAGSTLRVESLGQEILFSSSGLALIGLNSVHLDLAFPLRRVTLNQYGFYDFDKILSLGSPSHPWQRVFAKAYDTVADFYWLDNRKDERGNIVEVDDLEILRNLKPSGKFDPETGLQVIDDWSLPLWLFSHEKKGVLREQKRTTQRDDFVSRRKEIEKKEKEIEELEKTTPSFRSAQKPFSKMEDPIAKEVNELAEIKEIFEADFKGYDIDFDTIEESLPDDDEKVLVLSEDGKPYLNLVTVCSLLMGAIRQLDKKVEDHINSQLPLPLDRGL